MLLDVRGLPGLQRHSFRADCCSGCRVFRGSRTGRANVHRIVHAEDGGVHPELFPGVPPWGAIRQGHRIVGLFEINRCRRHRFRWPRTGNPVDRRCLRIADLFRRFPLCGGVCRLSIRVRTLSPERYSEAPDSRHDCARLVYLHDGCAARHAANPEHHSHHFLQD